MPRQDDTLYRCPEVPRTVLAGIHKFMVTHLGFTQEEASEKATELYLSHGTTLAGLVAHGAKIDYDQWHSEVHYDHIPYEQLIKPDPALRELLFSMDLPKYIFTNADKKHAEICMRCLGITDCFQGIIDFEHLHELAEAAGVDTDEHPTVVCKPTAFAYELVFKKLGVAASEVLFFDDSARNIQAAHELGVMTVMVGTDKEMPGADMSMVDLHQLPKMLPELIDQPGMVKKVTPGHEHKHMVSVVPR